MTKKFVKADLKGGMIVETRGNGKYLVLGNRLISCHGGMGLQNYGDDLHFNDTYCPDELDRDYDIIKIYKFCDRGEYPPINMIFDDEYLELIWQRNETKRMTVEEMRAKLEELTGEKIEVEPSRNEMIGKIYSYCDDVEDCDMCNLLGECAYCDDFAECSDEELKQCYEKVTEDFAIDVGNTLIGRNKS